MFLNQTLMSRKCVDDLVEYFSINVFDFFSNEYKKLKKKTIGIDKTEIIRVV